MALNRKSFVMGLTGGIGAMLLDACGGGGGGSYNNALTNPGTAPDAPTPAAGNCAANIAGNHGHALVIPPADLDATNSKTYDIQGAADHSHLVSFSAADLARLKAGTALTVLTSMTLDHQHSITERCA
jgi:hypothetical protein